MKKQYKILTILFVGMALIATSCMKDLDTEPLDKNVTTTNKVFKDTLAFKEA